MRIRLSDGTILETNSSGRTPSSQAPSKRNVKQGGGSMKRHHSRQSGFETSQGRLPGFGHTVKAIYADTETDPETGEVVRVIPKETAIVVNASKKTFTWDLGGSCSTGYIGGRGL